MIIDWSKAPDGFPIWLEDVRRSRLSADDHDRSSWACDAQSEYTLYCLGGSRGWWTKSREGIDFVVHRQPEPWNGEGLPPAGTVCEFQHRNAPNGVWHPTTIRFSSHAFVVFVDSIHDCEECWRVNDSCAIDFRPIRNAEQIAAEEREKGIEAIRKAVSSSANCKAHGVAWDVAGAIYDAGYRKQETTQ